MGTAMGRPPLVEKLVNRVVVSKIFKLKCEKLGNIVELVFFLA
jgi:hypothetical protein